MASATSPTFHAFLGSAIHRDHAALGADRPGLTRHRLEIGGLEFERGHRLIVGELRHHRDAARRIEQGRGIAAVDDPHRVIMFGPRHAFERRPAVAGVDQLREQRMGLGVRIGITELRERRGGSRCRRHRPQNACAFRAGRGRNTPEQVWLHGSNVAAAVEAVEPRSAMAPALSTDDMPRRSTLLRNSGRLPFGRQGRRLLIFGITTKGVE